MTREYLKRDYNYQVPGRESMEKRGIEHASPELWNKQMAQMNSKGEDRVDGKKMWYVNGNVYDLRKFIDKHPGGKQWIKLTQGQDITESYISHHINEEKCNQILGKYYIGKRKNYKPRFSFNDGEFYRTIKQRIYEKLGDNTGYTSETVIIGLSIFALWLFSFYLICVLRSYVIAVISGYLLFSVMGVGHNFFHQKDNIFKYLWDFSNFHHYDWTTSHVISHHPLPNTDQDIEIASFEPLLSSLTSQPALKSKNIAKFTMTVFGFLLSFGSFIVVNITTLFKTKLRLEYLIPLCELIVIYLTGQNNFWESFGLWFMMHGVSGIVMVFATFLSHRTVEDWQGGDKPISDWGIHVVYSAHDHNVHLPMFLSFLIFGGFNDHIIHHFFPTMDKVHFYKCREILEKTVKEFNLDYKKIEWFNGTSSVFDNYIRKRPEKTIQVDGVKVNSKKNN